MASRARWWARGTGSREEVKAAAALATPVNDRIPIIGSSGGPRRRQAFQEELWTYAESVPELGNATGWLSFGASRASMYVAPIEKDGRPGNPTDDARVLAATRGILGHANLPDFLEQAAKFWFVAGEMYLFGYENPDALRASDKSRWTVIGSNNVQEDGSTFRVTYAREDAQAQEVVRPTSGGGLSSPLIRIWDPDPRRPWEATSPIISSLDILRALAKITRLVPALSDQRIAGPRMLAVSDRLEVPPSTAAQRYSADSLVQRLAEAVVAARDNPAAVDNLLPIILRGDLTEEVFRKLEWSTEFPHLTVEIMELLMRRLATGLPLPAEVTLGEGETSHWGQWFTEESTVKLSIEPIVAKVAGALSRLWLPAVLSANGIDPDEWTIGWDVRSVMLRPDRSAIAVQMHDRGLLSDEATRRETGFDEKDAPTEEELARRAALPTSGDSTPGPDPGQGDRMPHQQSEPTNDNRDERSLPTRGDSERNAERSLDAAALIALTAALGRVGTKLRSSDRALRGSLAGEKCNEIHTRVTPDVRQRVDLSQAWPDGVLDAFSVAARGLGYDPECAQGAMHDYLAQCVTQGQAVDADVLSERIRVCGKG